MAIKDLDRAVSDKHSDSQTRSHSDAQADTHPDKEQGAAEGEATPYKPPRVARRAPPAGPDETASQLTRIEASRRTPFEKRVWTALCGVPRGRFTTYGLLSAHLGTSPRAVGNALRRNPFAPGVPCHRVVAAGGALGGFKGSWARRGEGEGITLDEKRRLLRDEGVRFDGGGRVLGTPWEFGGRA